MTLATLYDKIIELVQASLKLCMTIYHVIEAVLQFWLDILYNMLVEANLRLFEILCEIKILCIII